MQISPPRSLPLWRIFGIGLLPSTGCYFLWLKCRGVARGASGAAVPGGKVGGDMSDSIGTFNFIAVKNFSL